MFLVIDTRSILSRTETRQVMDRQEIVYEEMLIVSPE